MVTNSTPPPVTDSRYEKVNNLGSIKNLIPVTPPHASPARPLLSCLHPLPLSPQWTHMGLEFDLRNRSLIGIQHFDLTRLWGCRLEYGYRSLTLRFSSGFFDMFGALLPMESSFMLHPRSLYLDTRMQIGQVVPPLAALHSVIVAEAEYRGVANVVAETAWIHNLLRELHSPLSTATLVYCNNVSAVYLSSNPVQHQQTKHIEIDIHFLRDQVTAGHVRVLHVPPRD
ncbi:ribonuclease H-like domain-containing protein [Tanacetum coccineum]